MKQIFAIAVFVLLFHYTCSSQQENFTKKSKNINLSNHKGRVLSIQGSIIDVANGYCGVFCQGGMIEVKLKRINGVKSQDTIYIITECSNRELADNFEAKIIKTKPSDFINHCLFENYNQVPRFSKAKKLYKIW
jgi:predicted HTH transcriptional regulator